MCSGEITLYGTEDGRTEVQLSTVDGTVWLTQVQMAALFGTTMQNVSLHLRNILSDGEMAEGSVVKKSLMTAADGKAYQTKLYSLDAVLAVGYRLRSPCGVQFRRWATSTLTEYLVKGFAMNDERLKNPTWDRFDELLERIRDIRASEARFFQKVRDILALGEDYDPKSPDVHAFCLTIQDRMLCAVTGHTAAELIRKRSDPDQPSMGLTTWKGDDGGRPLRKADIGTARNYLGEEETKELNLIAEAFLNTAELRATRRQSMRLSDWERALEDFLVLNELPKLRGTGNVSATDAKRIAHEHYVGFDAKRREAERQIAAAEEDLDELKRIADATKTNRSGGRISRQPYDEGRRS